MIAMKCVRAYRYRWFILLALTLLTLAVEIQWMNMAPVGRVAARYYAGQLPSFLSSPVDVLTLVYMIVFVVVSLPSSFIINKLGVTVSIRLASGFIVFAGLCKIIYTTSFAIVVFGQFFMALAQALVLNSITEIVSRWFPIRERGMAVGIVSAAQYLSLGIVMVLSPLMVVTKANAPDYGSGFDRMIFVYSVVSMVFASLAAILIRENPPTPSSILYGPSKISFFRSFRAIVAIPSLRGLIIIFSIEWGVLMTLLSKIDYVGSLLGFPDSNGVLGIAMLVGGMVGAVVIPSLSDRFRKRKFFLVLCYLCSIPGIVLLLLSQYFSYRAPVALLGAFLLGLAVLSSLPIGTQYAAELGQGISEEIIQSILLLCSQATGSVIMILFLIEGGKYSSMLLTVLTALLVASMIGSTFLSESPVIVTEEERFSKVIDEEIVHLQ